MCEADGQKTKIEISMADVSRRPKEVPQTPHFSVNKNADAGGSVGGRLGSRGGSNPPPPLQGSGSISHFNV